MPENDTPLQGRRILVVEDDFLVGQTLLAMLEDAGAVVLGPIGWAHEALAFVANNQDQFDSAVLDINLHGEKSYPIADELVKLNVDFVFSTGYGANAVDPKYRNFKRCEKPFTLNMLVQALASN
jgi:DNA-binding LytR/AlgR family response regulator